MIAFLILVKDFTHIYSHMISLQKFNSFVHRYSCTCINAFDNVFTETGTENLRVCLKIIEAYLLLCPHQFMHVST